MSLLIARLVCFVATVLVAGASLLIALFLLRLDSAWWPLPAVVSIACAWATWALQDEGS